MFPHIFLRVNVGISRTEDNLKGMAREVSSSKVEDKGKIKVVGTEGNNNSSISYLTTFGAMLYLGLRTSAEWKYNFRHLRPLGLKR